MDSEAWAFNFHYHRDKSSVNEYSTNACTQQPDRRIIVNYPSHSLVVYFCVTQIVATAVCHTDLYHLLENVHKDGFPTVLGHEAAGIIESVGPGVTEYQPGQIRMGQNAFKYLDQLCQIKCLFICRRQSHPSVHPTVQRVSLLQEPKDQPVRESLVVGS